MARVDYKVCNRTSRGGTGVSSTLKIKYVKGHYEAYKDGIFLMSGSTLEEIIRDIEELEKEEQTS